MGERLNNAQMCGSCGAEMTGLRGGEVVNDCGACGARFFGAQTPPVENLPNLCPTCRHAIAPEHDDFGCHVLDCQCTITGKGTVDQIQAVLPNADEKANATPDFKAAMAAFESHVKSCAKCRPVYDAAAGSAAADAKNLCPTGAQLLVADLENGDPKEDAAQIAMLADGIKHEASEIAAERSNMGPITLAAREAAGAAAYGSAR